MCHADFSTGEMCALLSSVQEASSLIFVAKCFESCRIVIRKRSKSHKRKSETLVLFPLKLEMAEYYGFNLLKGTAVKSSLTHSRNQNGSWSNSFSFEFFKTVGNGFRFTL